MKDWRRESVVATAGAVGRILAKCPNPAVPSAPTVSTATAVPCRDVERRHYSPDAGDNYLTVMSLYLRVHSASLPITKSYG